MCWCEREARMDSLMGRVGDGSDLIGSRANCGLLSARCAKQMAAAARRPMV